MARRTAVDPATLDLAGLIRTCKGSKRWDQLIARRPIDETGQPYGPDRNRLEQMVRKPMIEFPKPRTMEGLAVMLGVSADTVLHACARSVAYGANHAKSRFELLIPPGVEDLPPEVQDMFLDQLRLAVRMAKQPPAGDLDTVPVTDGRDAPPRARRRTARQAPRSAAG